jgi:hypothetical protein
LQAGESAKFDLVTGAVIEKMTITRQKYRITFQAQSFDGKLLTDSTLPNVSIEP